MEEALRNIFAMYFVMMAAYFLKKKVPFQVEVVNDLVFNFFLPVTIFFSILGIRQVKSWEFARMALAGMIVLCLTCLAAYLFVAIIARSGRSGNFKRTLLLGASYGNHAFLGFPVAYAFLGDRGVVLAIFYLIGGYFFLYILGFYVMTGRMTISSFLKNPLVIAMVAGVAFVLLGLRLPTFLAHTFSLMSKATFPLSMVVVGGGLKLAFFRESANVAYTSVASCIKLLLSPLLAYAVGVVFSLGPEELMICVLQSGMPAAVLVTVFAVKYEGDEVFSNSIVSLTTLASIGTIPLISLVLHTL